METITLNGKEYKKEDLTQDQLNAVREALVAQELMGQHEYQYVLLKTRYDSILRNLEEQLTAEADGEAA
jgi:hypothetical protein